MMNFVIDEAIEILNRTPAVLRSLLTGLSDPWLHGTEGPDTFSPHNVIGHLIHGEETDWIPRIVIIIEHGEARTFDTFDRFAFRELYSGAPISDLLDRFAALRAQNIDCLRRMNLLESQLELKGMHPQLGQVTLRQLLATWVVHDLTHISQVVRVLAKQYEDAVGPWKAYLRVLQS